MDMRKQAQRRFQVTLTHRQGYRFESQASEDGRPHGPAFSSDEPDPVGAASAPSTPALLGAAVGHCLSASLLEALRRARVDLVDLETEVVSVVAPNPAGLPRIDHVDVTIRPVLRAASPLTRRCEDVFERYCTVTSSVRQGIDVRVQVEWRLQSADAPADAPAGAPAADAPTGRSARAE